MTTKSDFKPGDLLQYYYCINDPFPELYIYLGIEPGIEGIEVIQVFCMSNQRFYTNQSRKSYLKVNLDETPTRT
mgnify:CR=1 FL=1